MHGRFYRPMLHRGEGGRHTPQKLILHTLFNTLYAPCVLSLLKKYLGNPYLKMFYFLKLFVAIAPTFFGLNFVLLSLSLRALCFMDQKNRP